MQLQLNESEVVAAVQAHLASMLPGLEVTRVEITDGVVFAEVVPVGSAPAPEVPVQRRARRGRNSAPLEVVSTGSGEEPTPLEEDADGEDNALPWATEEEQVPADAPVVSGKSLFG